MNRTTSGRRRFSRKLPCVDAGCCNLAAQIALSVLYGLSAREAVQSAPHTFRALVRVSGYLWRSFDTPEALAARVIEEMPPDLRDLIPSKVDRAEGWGRLMETIRCSRHQTRAEPRTTTAETRRGEGRIAA